LAEDCGGGAGDPEEMAPAATHSNTATVLKLPQKGRLTEGTDADVLVLRKDRLEIYCIRDRGLVDWGLGWTMEEGRCLGAETRVYSKPILI